MKCPSSSRNPSVLLLGTQGFGFSVNPPDSIIERIALDQQHGVEEATVFGLADPMQRQSIPGCSSRPARYFRFDQEAFPAFGDFRQRRPQEFNGQVPSQLLITSSTDDSQPPVRGIADPSGRSAWRPSPASESVRSVDSADESP